ncbi:MAG: RsmD family RNA methyltransferase [Alphaproteobacteria bacterium]|nr:MAG: RsmD family RNA methyltransferase [Alphaproteobacteria bacterium]
MGNRSVLNPRILKGKYRMKSIPVVEPARPPLARVRRVIFDMIESRHTIENALDLCCGSGSLGLEAISRGAKHVTFVDNNRDNIYNLKQTLETWAIETNIIDSVANLCVVDARKIKLEKHFDTIFIDLPFFTECEADILQNLVNNTMISHGALVVVKTNRKTSLNIMEGFDLLKYKQEGKSALYLLQFTDNNLSEQS